MKSNKHFSAGLSWMALLALPCAGQELRALSFDPAILTPKPQPRALLVSDDQEHEPPLVDDLVKYLEGEGRSEEFSNYFAQPDYRGLSEDAQYPAAEATGVSVYTDKNPIPTQRPLLEWGRDLYTTGNEPGGGLRPTYDLFGEVPFHHLYVYGDWRTAVGHSNLGEADTARAVTRLNLDVDLGLTSTERIHALIRPLDRNTEFTQVGISGLDEDESELLLDGNLETLFFEGDATAMFTSPGDASLPIAIGKMPLLFQNGVWVEDAFTGIAVSIPAKNSPSLDISNYDFTFFAAVDDVTTGANPVGGEDGEDDVSIFGVTTFVEANDGYWELGYGFADLDDGFDYHNVTASFSKRYGAFLSNSVRVIGNFGQDPDGGADKTADGVLLLVENSFMTKKPYTVLPYANFFAGFGTPQSLARDAGAGGVLKNTGLNFEADALTRFPSLDATGHDAVGGAIGIQYLLGTFDQQIVLEVAGQHAHGDDAKALGDEYAVGLRYQKPLTLGFLDGRKAAIFRADAMYGIREDGEDIAGIRFEFRWKF